MNGNKISVLERAAQLCMGQEKIPAALREDGLRAYAKRLANEQGIEGNLRAAQWEALLPLLRDCKLTAEEQRFAVSHHVLSGLDARLLSLQLRLHVLLKDKEALADHRGQREISEIIGQLGDLGSAAAPCVPLLSRMLLMNDFRDPWSPMYAMDHTEQRIQTSPERATYWESVRLAAAEALGKIGTEPASQALKLEALHKTLLPKVERELPIHNMNGEDDRLRVALETIGAIRRIGDPASLPMLREALAAYSEPYGEYAERLNFNGSRVSVQNGRVYSHSYHERSHGMLSTTVGELVSKRNSCRTDIILALGELGSDADIALLTGQLTTRNAIKRAKAVTWRGVGNTEVREDTQLRRLNEAVVRALSAMGSVRAMAALQRIAQDDAMPKETRELAAESVSKFRRRQDTALFCQTVNCQ